MPRDASTALARRKALHQSTCTRAPLRPRDMVIKPTRLLREPSTPVESLVRALLDRDDLGLGGHGLVGESIYNDVTLTLSIEEIPGAVAGYFQDLPTYKLTLALEPVLFMRKLFVELDDFTGYPGDIYAPLWLRCLGHRKGRGSMHLVRTYVWLQTFVQQVQEAHNENLPYKRGWDDILRYVQCIKTTRDEAKRPRPAVPHRIRPRPVWRSLSMLTDSLGQLNLSEKLPDVEQVRRKLEGTRLDSI